MLLPEIIAATVRLLHERALDRFAITPWANFSALSTIEIAPFTCVAQEAAVTNVCYRCVWAAASLHLQPRLAGNGAGYVSVTPGASYLRRSSKCLAKFALLVVIPPSAAIRALPVFRR